MKIAAFLDGRADSGGGFNQALNAILQMRDIVNNKRDFMVVTTIRENVRYLELLGIRAEYLKPSISDKLMVLCALNPIAKKIQSKLKLVGTLEQYLLRQQVDLVYFLAPTLRTISLQRLNYIITVWDLCHRDTPEFPEVRLFNEFLSREQIYNHCLAQALFILVDSSVLAERIVTRYGVEYERIIIMPFSPSPFLVVEKSNNTNVLQKYGIQDGYFFYPAQFWAHKNHIRILEALLLLREKGLECRVVFCGSDKGNAKHVKQFVYDHGLSAKVKIVDFVPAADMRGLYQHCQAVVMPTYFGTTNIPPLEAWLLEKPLIYSDSFREQVGEAAICVNPDSAGELAEAMQELAESDLKCAELVRVGTDRLREVDEERKHAEELLRAALSRFEKRRRCWK